MVLAAGGDRQLFGRAVLRRPLAALLARHALRDGHGGHFSTLAAGPISQTLVEDGKPIGKGGKALPHAFPRFADDLAWWMEAAKAQRGRKKPPY